MNECIDVLEALVNAIMDEHAGADILPVHPEWDPEHHLIIAEARRVRAEGGDCIAALEALVNAITDEYSDAYSGVDLLSINQEDYPEHYALLQQAWKILRAAGRIG